MHEVTWWSRVCWTLEHALGFSFQNRTRWHGQPYSPGEYSPVLEWKRRIAAIKRAGLVFEMGRKCYASLSWRTRLKKRRNNSRSAFTMKPRMRLLTSLARKKCSSHTARIFLPPTRIARERLPLRVPIA